MELISDYEHTETDPAKKLLPLCNGQSIWSVTLNIRK